MVFLNTKTDSSIRSHLNFKNFAFGLALAVFVYLILILLGNWEELLVHITRVPVYIIILAMLLSFSNYCFRFLKWVLFTNNLELNIPLKENFKVFIAGLSLAITPGKAGEAIRAFLLKEKSDVHLSKGLASMFSELLIDLLAVALLSAIGIFLMQADSAYMIVILVILLLVTVGVIIFLFDPLYLIFSKVFNIGPLKKLGVFIDKFRMDVIVSITVSTFFISLGLGMIGWSCECLGFMIIANSLGIPMTFPMATFIYATASILGAVSFLPGGLGLMEGGLGLFVIDLLGVSASLSVALTLLIRLSTLWFGVCLGLIFLIWNINDINKKKMFFSKEDS